MAVGAGWWAVRILGAAEGTLFGLVAGSYVASAIVCTTATLLGLNRKMPGRTSGESAVS